MGWSKNLLVKKWEYPWAYWYPGPRFWGLSPFALGSVPQGCGAAFTTSDEKPTDGRANPRITGTELSVGSRCHPWAYWYPGPRFWGLSPFAFIF